MICFRNRLTDLCTLYTLDHTWETHARTLTDVDVVVGSDNHRSVVHSLNHTGDVIRADVLTVTQRNRDESAEGNPTQCYNFVHVMRKLDHHHKRYQTIWARDFAKSARRT